MSKFKVGDKVVSVTEYAYPCPELWTEEGVVVEVRDPNDFYPYKVDYPHKKDVLFLERELALYEKDTSTGAAWAVTTNDRVLADDDKREDYPLFDGVFAYFPAALCEVARWSKVGNNKHNPGEKLHWAREKSTDHENKILRHLLDADKEMDDGFIEATALAWRALALCQTLLEKRGWAEGANGRWKRDT